jgi:hypothetical protein
MQQIQKLVNYYVKLAERHKHNESIKNLKKQYLDVCSAGDVIINTVIDMLAKESNNNNIEKLIIKYSEEFNNNEYFDSVIDNLITTIEEFYKNGLNPNPYWYD